MIKIAIIDLDMVLADSTERFKRAEEAKVAFLTDMQSNPERRLDNILMGHNSKTWEKQSVDIYWKTAFDPDLIALDTLTPGTDDAIEQLEAAGFQIVYLTSRPESLREATTDWLIKNKLFGPMLVMKAPPFQFTKTTVWKAGMIQTLAIWLKAEELLIVDDQEENRAAISTGGFEDSSRLRCYTSLAEAVEAI